jgi:mono/diheme cytochrome c family protein
MADAPGPYFHQLFINGRPATRARTPNDGFFHFEGSVTAYVRSLEPQVTPVSMSSQDLDVAAKLFAPNCVSCHGEHGAGDGAAAGGIKPSPVNFHVRQPSPERAWTVLELGVPGSSMPAWRNRLSENNRHLLARYVRSLYDGGHKEEQVH